VVIGDVIQKSIDRDYRTFLVPLPKFIQRLVNPNGHAADEEEADTSAFHYTNAHVSFIRIARRAGKHKRHLWNGYVARLWRTNQPSIQPKLVCCPRLM
jgi:hypothetical protein